MRLRSNTNIHGVTGININHEAGDGWIDIVALGEDSAEFETTLFIGPNDDDRRQRAIDVLESMKAQITNILQELDNAS